MWIWIANKFAKFHAKRLNRRENIPKSFRGWLLFLKYPVYTLWWLWNLNRFTTGRHNLNTRPSMMCAPLSASDSRRHRNRAAAGDLDVPFSRISYGERSFAVSGPTCWNALPSELKFAASTLDHFCSGLKTVLFIRSYYAWAQPFITVL